MDATLVLNERDEIALLYGHPLGIEATWATIDAELGQINIYDENSQERFLKLDKIKPDIYERIMKEDKILLVQVEDNDATKPVEARYVPIGVATQI